mgnify:CR=1 FL=1
MLMGDEVYVKPASRESRLVMVRLEPKAKKKPKREKQNKTKQRETTTRTRTRSPENKAALQRIFLTSLWKHIAIGKGLMTAHAHDVRLQVRRKRSNFIEK